MLAEIWSRTGKKCLIDIFIPLLQTNTIHNTKSNPARIKVLKSEAHLILLLFVFTSEQSFFAEDAL